jgi:hypothetical protein
MIESDLQRTIQVEAPAATDRLWRFPVGNYQLAKGGFVNVGIPGMSDLLGYASVLIEPHHVGQLMAVFTAVEVKRPTTRNRVTPEQLRFLRLVAAHGGRAGVATSVPEARAILAGERLL